MYLFRTTCILLSSYLWACTEPVGLLGESCTEALACGRGLSCSEQGICEPAEAVAEAPSDTSDPCDSPSSEDEDCDDDQPSSPEPVDPCDSGSPGDEDCDDQPSSPEPVDPCDSGSPEDEDCNAEPDPSDNCEPNCVLNYVFVTSTAHPTDFGGIEAADAICQARAEAGNLPENTYRAWLSTTEVNARDRLEGARGWIRLDERPVFDTVDELVQGARLYPILLDEFGDAVPGREVMTGTYDGELETRSDESWSCNDWTIADGSAGVLFGYNDATGRDWDAGLGTASCREPYHLYCFGVDHNTPLPAPSPESGRLAFLAFTGEDSPQTPQAWDQACADVAEAAGVEGQFLAMVATTEASAQDRFQMDGPPWVRPDGLTIAATAEDLFSGELLISMNQGLDGYVYTVSSVTTGATSPVVAATPELSCLNWTTTDAEAQYMAGRSTRTTSAFFEARRFICSDPTRFIYCLEE